MVWLWYCSLVVINIAIVVVGVVVVVVDDEIIDIVDSDEAGGG